MKVEQQKDSRQKKIVQIEDLSVAFDGMEVVKHVNIEVNSGEIVGIVGESGSGKSITSLTLMGLLSKQAQVTSGKIIVDGEVLREADRPFDEKLYRRFQGSRMSMIFQEPMTSLNPTKKAGIQVDEIVRLHTDLEKEKRYEKVLETFQAVGLKDAKKVYDSYPHQLSGGMRQRVMIAMALACRPKLLIADEPTTALDVTIQAQILRLMNDLKRENGTSILFITHDLGVINQMADYVAVMYCGQVVERVPAKMLFDPKTEYSHPYTEGLLVSIPRLDTPTNQRLEAIPGAVPHPLDLPKGCKFAPRCKYATEKCHEAEPPMTHLTEEHHIRCYYPNKEERKQNVK